MGQFNVNPFGDRKTFISLPIHYIKGPGCEVFSGGQYYVCVKIQNTCLQDGKNQRVIFSIKASSTENYFGKYKSEPQSQRLKANSFL